MTHILTDWHSKSGHRSFFSQGREMWDCAAVYNFGLGTLTIGREWRKEQHCDWVGCAQSVGEHLQLSTTWTSACYKVQHGVGVLADLCRSLWCKQDKHPGWKGSCSFWSLHTLVIHSYSDSLKKILSSKHVPDKALPLGWDWANGVLSIVMPVSTIHIHSWLHSLRFSSTFYKKVQDRSTSLSKCLIVKYFDKESPKRCNIGKVITL